MKLPKFLINTEFLEHLSVPIFVKSKSGTYVYCNSAFAKLIGKPPNEIINKTPSEILPKGVADELKKQDIELQGHQILDKGHPPATIESEIDFNESEIDFSVKKWIIYDINHDVSGFIGAIHRPSSKHLRKIPSEYKKLTKREIEVATLLAKGKSIKGIANSLGISPHTATDHVKSIYLKLDVHSKNEAIYKMLPVLAGNVDFEHEFTRNPEIPKHAEGEPL